MRGSPHFCARLWRNCQIISKNSALTQRGKLCLSKSALFSLIETLCNSRDNQVTSQPACLYFMMQLQKVIGHAHKLLLDYAKRNKIASGVIFRGKNGRPLDRSSIWRQMKQLCRQARVPESKVFSHNLRKLFARTFYGIEKDIAKLADILGHSSINTTRIYIMTTGAEHRLKIERLGLVV